ncbi:MAG: hypothetical protein GF381_03885 [Candidatus Pacebacteria bacterium]|nr:hypothetical protein [Candidatus Paceibacterota bacterium]
MASPEREVNTSRKPELLGQIKELMDQLEDQLEAATIEEQRRIVRQIIETIEELPCLAQRVKLKLSVKNRAAQACYLELNNPTPDLTEKIMNSKKMEDPSWVVDLAQVIVESFANRKITEQDYRTLKHLLEDKLNEAVYRLIDGNKEIKDEIGFLKKFAQEIKNSGDSVLATVVEGVIRQANLDRNKFGIIGRFLGAAILEQFEVRCKVYGIVC